MSEGKWGNHQNVSQDSHETHYRPCGNQKALGFSLHLGHVVSTLLLSAHLFLSLCTVSGHLIAISPQDLPSRKEGFNIWIQ